MSDPSIAVIIPTAGRSKQLVECLLSLEHCGFIGAGVRALVVDNNSEQNLSALVKDVVNISPNVEYVNCQRPGLSSARHHATIALASDVYCYVDDDVVFSETWIDSIRKSFHNEDIAIAGGPTVPNFKGSVPSWFWDFLSHTPYGGWCCPWLSLLDIGHDVDNIAPNWIWGLNFAIRREALLCLLYTSPSPRD